MSEFGDDLDEFLSRIDELTGDSSSSTSIDPSVHQKLLHEHKKLKQLLITTRDENNEMVDLYRQTAQCVVELKLERDHVKEECKELRNQLDVMNKENINQSFSFKQQVGELKENQSQQTKDYSDLCREYLELISEMTCFYNYQIKRAEMRRTISKSEVFLRQIMGSAFEKPKILRTKMGCDSDSVTSKTSTEAGKKRCSRTKDSETKRRKTEIWDMKSISQASSPAASVNFIDEGTSDLSSGVFSIGNETTYSLHESTIKVPEKHCNCNAADNNATLVSVATNTDCPEVLPSVPCLLADDFNETSLDARNEIIQDIATLDHSYSSDETCEPEAKNVKPTAPAATLVPTYVSCSTSTEPEVMPASKKLVNQETSTDRCGPSVDKGTSTVHSLVTRGNQTAGVRQSDKGIQMPEVCLEDIFEETLFELPDALTPLIDEVELTKSVGTITDLCNVTREIDLVRTPLLTTDVQEPLARNTIEDDNAFIVLGQTLFRLFLKRMQKSSKSVSTEDYAKKQIWKLLRRELKDRYSELTFDELLNRMDTERLKAFNGDDEMNDDSATESKHSLKLLSPIKDLEEKEGYEGRVPPETSVCIVGAETSTEMVGIESGVVDLPNYTKEAYSEKQNQAENSETSQCSLGIQSKSKGAAPAVEPLEVAVITETPTVSMLETPTVTTLASSGRKNFETQSEEAAFASELDSQFEKAMEELKSLLFKPRDLVTPIEGLADVIWKSLFPLEESTDSEVSPPDNEALDGFDIEHEPIEIPLDAEVEQILREPVREYNEFETPRSPPPFMKKGSDLKPVIIPTESRKIVGKVVHAQLNFDPELRKSLVTWQERHKISSKTAEKLLCKARKAIANYLNSQEWNDESLEKCIKVLVRINNPTLRLAIFETLEDNSMEDEVNTQFTPPAPPLPRYQQKLIVLVEKLSQNKPNLPHELLEDLECRIFNFECFAAKTSLELRNLSYWATALIDLFFNGDPTIALYFIVKCIYFFGYKSIPMSYVIIKAFPAALPKKNHLMKMNCKDVDWENMTGLQLSKVKMDVEWIDSLELTVMSLLMSKYLVSVGKNDETCQIEDHALFHCLTRSYGYMLSSITPAKLLEVLLQRLESGRLENLSLSLILLGKRSSSDFAIDKMFKEKLVPLLRSAATVAAEMTPEMTARTCLLIEAMSSILKGFPDEKEKSFTEVFALIVSILARTHDSRVKDTCLLAILRLQRFVTNQQEIYNIVKDNYQATETNMNDTLSHSIRTFVHRKNKNFFKSEA